jgi:septum site-determining protein MinD
MGKTDVRLIVNRVSKKMIAATDTNIDDIMDKAGLPLLGVVPEDPNVILASTFRQPLLGYTARGAAAACRRIARRLQGFREPIRI